MSLVNISNIGLFSAQTDNRGRFDPTYVGGDSSNSQSFNRRRGRRSQGNGHKRGGYKNQKD